MFAGESRKSDTLDTRPRMAEPPSVAIALRTSLSYSLSLFSVGQAQTPQHAPCHPKLEQGLVEDQRVSVGQPRGLR
jgi:hypothetical protein